MTSIYAGLDSLPSNSYRTVATKKNGRSSTTTYICLYPDCDYTNRKSTTFIVHARKHYGICPFKCAFCGRCFTQSGSLKRHLQTLHDVHH